MDQIIFLGIGESVIGVEISKFAFFRAVWF